MKKFVVVMLLLLALPVFAQTPAPAKVDKTATVAEPKAEQPEPLTIPLDKEVDLTLQLAVTELDNLQLKATLQQERIQAYIKSIAKAGYTVRKGQDGHWEYAKIKETK